MEKVGVGFLDAGWIVNTHNVRTWRFRNPSAAVAYHMAEKAKKLDFPLKVCRVLCLKSHRENGVRNI